MSVTVRFVGSGDAFGSGGRFNTCILVDGLRSRVAFDFGASSLTALARQGNEHNSIEADPLTHFPGDHCGGLPFLLLDAMLSAKPPRPPAVAGPRDLQRRMDRVRDAFVPGSGVVTPDIPLRRLETEPGLPLRIRDLVMTPQVARHTKETNPTALRAEVGGRVSAYTGDSEWTEEVAKFCPGAEPFLAECCF